MVGGTREVRMDGEALFSSSVPVDIAFEPATMSAEIRVHGKEPVKVTLAAALGGTGRPEMLAPGTHGLSVKTFEGADITVAAQEMPVYRLAD
jgi:hypothetical protein